MDKNQVISDLGILIDQVKNFLISSFPKFILALTIFIIGLILARIIQMIVNRIIDRIYKYLNTKSQRKEFRQVTRDPSTRLISKIAYWIILIIFLTAATEIMGLPIITTWLGGIINYLPNVFLAVIILFSGIIAGRLLREILTAAIIKSGMVFGEIIGHFIQYAVITIAILIAITQIGVDLEILISVINITLAALLFGAALAFGLGANTSVSNILAGYYLKERYQEGNMIKIDDLEGRIVSITTTSVVIETDNGQVTVPAKKFNEENSVLLKNRSGDA